MGLGISSASRCLSPRSRSIVVTPLGMPRTRRIPLFARLSPRGGLIAAAALVVAVVLAGCGSLSAAITPTDSTPTVAPPSLPQVHLQTTRYRYDMTAAVAARL